MKLDSNRTLGKTFIMIFRSTKSVHILYINHVICIRALTQEWKENWPLSDGTYVNSDIVSKAIFNSILNEEPNPQYDEINKRLKLIHTFGNLTFLTQPLNSSISNSSYKEKRKYIIEQSALRLNRYFQNILEWNEDSIIKRSEFLLTTALKIWKYPEL